MGPGGLWLFIHSRSFTLARKNTPKKGGIGKERRKGEKNLAFLAESEVLHCRGQTGRGDF